MIYLGRNKPRSFGDLKCVKVDGFIECLMKLTLKWRCSQIKVQVKSVSEDFANLQLLLV